MTEKEVNTADKGYNGKRPNKPCIKMSCIYMNSIASEAQYRQRVIRYAEKHGVTAASIRHRRNRQAIYEWKAKYNGSQRAEYPSQKVQIDVKYVPSWCVANGQKYYQYTAIDACTRLVFREMYDEHSTYGTIQQMVEYDPEDLSKLPVSQ